MLPRAALIAALIFAGAPAGVAFAAEEPTTPAVSASPAPGEPPMPAVRRLSIGYAVGNGAVELAQPGAELTLRPGPHVAFGVQVGRLANNSYSGMAVAPALRITLEPEGGPYLALGGLWVNLSAQDAGQTVKLNGLGGFANLGYEWRPSPAFGLYGGAGIGFMPGQTIDRGGFQTVGQGGVAPNLELGARWYPF